MVCAFGPYLVTRAGITKCVGGKSACFHSSDDIYLSDWCIVRKIDITTDVIHSCCAYYSLLLVGGIIPLTASTDTSSFHFSFYCRSRCVQCTGVDVYLVNIQHSDRFICKSHLVCPSPYFRRFDLPDGIYFH